MAESRCVIDLFGAEGLDALARLARGPALYAFDFDGTLAPIVVEPDQARAGARTVALLRRLGALVPTALVTGRSADDLRGRIEFTPRYLVGNHGAEGVPAASHLPFAGVDDHADAAAHRALASTWLAQWPEAIGPAGTIPGILVEPKAYSLSIHYRAAADHAIAQAAIAAAIARLDPPPRVIGGKCVFNLLPAGAPDKGTALLALVRLERGDAAFFIGDDLTDEAAFQIAPPSWVTVRVGELADSAARYFIPAQGDIDRCLELLLIGAERMDYAR